jgi:hypothetical protein
MFKFQVGSDTIQLGILVIAGICMLGGFAAWCDSRYGKETEIKAVNDRLDSMQSEVHQIYGKLIPQSDRVVYASPHSH